MKDECLQDLERGISNVQAGVNSCDGWLTSVSSTVEILSLYGISFAIVASFFYGRMIYYLSVHFQLFMREYSYI